MKIEHTPAIVFFLITLSAVSIYFLKQTEKKKVDQIAYSSPRLAKVLRHYQASGETVKLEAAKILIQNLKNQYHFQGDGVQNYRQIIKEISHHESRKGLTRTWDSLASPFSNNLRENIAVVADINVLTDKLLIDHIDAAFKAWDFPWSKSTLSFSDFCEYILPYKLANEEPSRWMSDIQKDKDYRFAANNSILGPFEATILLNHVLKRKFHFETFEVIWDLNYHDLNLIKAGSCAEATQFTTYCMRSFGIPTVIDFTPYWGNLNGGHVWNALIVNKKPRAYVGAESDPGLTKLDLAFQRKRAKVFRKCFIADNSKLKEIGRFSSAPLFLKSPYIKDVTSDYIPTSDVTIPTPKDLPANAHIAFVSVFNSQKWQPIFWGQLKNKRVLFKNLGRGVVYLPTIVTDGHSPIGDPFLITNGGLSEVIKADFKHVVDIQVTKKGPQGPAISKGKTYELVVWKNGWSHVANAIADTSFVCFDNVPSKGLYWVRSKDKPKNERIFLFKKGKQEWY